MLPHANVKTAIGDAGRECSKGAIAVWDAADSDHTGSEPRLLYGHSDFVKAMAWSPDGESLLSGGSDGRVLLWEVESVRATPLYVHTDAVESVAFGPDARSLADVVMRPRHLPRQPSRSGGLHGGMGG
jgi:WD40 repeat protein